MASADGAAFPLNSAAVAIDKDKNSQYAVKWAIDHFVSRTNLLILIHVRPRNPGGADAAGYDTDPKQIFTSYRGFCARKSLNQIQLKEIILEDNDAGRAILEFVKTNFIANIVVGGCTRNAIVKTFKKPDVPSYLTKNAPEFCSVYVIGKSKILSVRSASRPVANTATPPKLPGPQVLQQQPSAEHAPAEECGPRTPARRVITSGIDRSYIERNIESMRSRLQPMYSWNSNLSAESLDMSYGTPSIQGSDRSSSISDDDRILDPFAFRNPIDVSANKNSDFSFVGDPRRDENPSVPQNDLEAEMRRLRLELKQTMDMYSTACREAITAKHKAKELNDWKMTELRKYEQARYAEESALATIEMEKAKCRAAMEAAEAAQRLAEKEAQKRKLAEEKAKREAEGKKRALTQLAHKEVRYRKYTIEEVEIATDKFSMQFKIGEGGYGPVFRGVLDHTPVAIKILRPDAAQGQKQFQQEVEVLSCMRHPNMVLLLGACPEYGCLVYEYMNNGSLEDRLLRKGGTPPIPWRIRFRIAAEIATGLSFLHQAKPEPLVHRDLKPANILLDQNYVSKISDVGLARLVPPSVADTVTQYHMTSAAGTFCYIDPEYQQTGRLTTKSDVYSFGIMLLQIITAKPAMGLSHQVQRSIDRGTFSEILDPTVCDWPLEETLTFAKLALKCCELRKRDRPDLSTVVLPVLNRLKELGTSEDDNNFYGYQLTKHPSMSRNSGGSRSSLSQEDISSQMSDQSVQTATWGASQGSDDSRGYSGY